MKNICILRLSALGDCCHALSIVQTLQRHLPDSNISWVINKKEYQLFRDIPRVDFIVVDKENLVKSFSKIFFSKRKRVFDVLLNLHASASANFISMAIRAERKIGYDKARARDKQNWFCDEYIQPASNQHVADAMVGFLLHLNIKEVRPSWSPLQLRSEEEKVKKYVSPSERICLISPCSSQRYGDKYNRSWPVEKYIEIIRYLSEEKGFRVIVSGGRSPIEISYSEQIDNSHFENNVFNLIGKTSIREMAALVKLSDLVISPDSGPAHVSTVMGTPVIGLYAMSNPKRSGPYNSKSLLVNKYPETLAKYYKVSSEKVKWGKKVKNPRAMDMIEVADVCEKIEQFLADEVS
mgnify:FL=1